MNRSARARLLIETARYIIDNPRSSERAQGDPRTRTGLKGRVLELSYLFGLWGLFFYFAYLIAGALPRYRFAGNLLVADHAAGVIRNALNRLPTSERAGQVRVVPTRRTALLLEALWSLGLFRQLYRSLTIGSRPRYAAMANFLFSYLTGKAALGSRRPESVLITITSDRRRLALGVAAEVLDLPLGVFLVDRHGTSRHLPFRAEALFCWTHKQQRYYERYAREVVVMPSPLRPIRPAPAEPKVGLLLNARVIVKELRAFLETLRERHGLRRVHVRPHPGFDAGKLTDLGDAVIREWKQPLGEFLDELDLAFGPNTNALMDAVMHGVPTIYVGGLDPYAYDLHGYVADGVVLAYDREHRYPESANKFYRSDEFARAWEEVGYQADGTDEHRVLTRLIQGGTNAPS